MSLLPAREILRTPITCLLTITATCITLLIPLMHAFQFGDTGRRMARDGGLGLLLSVGTILAAAGACSIIRRERESGITAMLLTKPISRSLYLLSRFNGVAIMILLFSAIMAPTTMLAHRAAEAYHPESGTVPDPVAAVAGLLCVLLACLTGAWFNWKKHTSFHAVVMLSLPLFLWTTCLLAGWFTRARTFTLQYNPELDPRIILAALSLAWVLMTFASIALTVSIYLPPVSTAVLCLIILFAGFSTPALMASTGLLRPFVALLPNWNWFWLTETIDTAPQQIMGRFSLAILYGLSLVTATLLIGMNVMKRVEVPS